MPILLIGKRKGVKTLRIPTVDEANAFLAEGKRSNPGGWVAHSLNVAKAARLIAECHPELDPEKSYVLGLLHDIGRRAGVTEMRHTLDGYYFLMDKGFDDAARICMTHSFPEKNPGAVFGKWDCSNEELNFAWDYLQHIEFNEYDLLIQLGDALALPAGFCLMEKRMIDVAMRYGTTTLIADKWKALFALKTHFESKIGCSIYKLLPGIIENTFGIGENELS